MKEALMKLNAPAQEVLDAFLAKWKAEEDLRLAEQKLNHTINGAKGHAPFERRI